jgi:hypothetical protein
VTVEAARNVLFAGSEIEIEDAVGAEFPINT